MRTCNFTSYLLYYANTHVLCQDFNSYSLKRNDIYRKIFYLKRIHIKRAFAQHTIIENHHNNFVEKNR